MKKNILFALASILGSSTAANAAVVKSEDASSVGNDQNHEIIQGIKKQKTFLLKVNPQDLERSMACFHTSHASHSSHASHASHASSSFV